MVLRGDLWRLLKPLSPPFSWHLGDTDFVPSMDPQRAGSCLAVPSCLSQGFCGPLGRSEAFKNIPHRKKNA